MRELFTHGRRHFSDRVREVDEQDLNRFWKMYKHKFWGDVDGETWVKNNEAANAQEGQITAKYTTDSGRVVFIVRVPDCSHALMVTPRDIEEQYVENLIRQMTERHDAIQRAARQLRSSSRNGGLFG